MSNGYIGTEWEDGIPHEVRAARAADRIARETAESIADDYELSLDMGEDYVERFWQGFLSVTPTYDRDGDLVSVDVEVTTGGPSVRGSMTAEGVTVWVSRHGQQAVRWVPLASRCVADLWELFDTGEVAA